MSKKSNSNKVGFFDGMVRTVEIVVGVILLIIGLIAMGVIIYTAVKVGGLIYP